MTERYTLGYGPASLSIMASRTAESHAGFFISHLRTGMSVLDIGCGPGSITFGFAECVRPGSVIGTDLVLGQTKRFAEKAEGAELNLTFEMADAYALPYSDNCFDAVFVSALLGNLRCPQDGADQAYRVLKPGGLFGIKEFDEGANLSFPELESRTRLIQLYRRLREHHGHDPDCGRKLRSYLNTAGFVDIEVEATFEAATPRLGASGNAFVESMVREEWGSEFVELGWVTQEQIDDWVKQSSAYRSDQGDFSARAWVEAIARKPD